MAGTFKIDINTQTLVSTADKINSINRELDDKLSKISKAMRDLENDWQSDGAETIRSAMEAMLPRFAKYKEVVDAYEKYLRNTAQSYESTETTVQGNATEVQNNASIFN